MTSLVLTLPLRKGETPSGYVSRLAQLYQTTPRDFCSDLGSRWPFLCSGREDQLRHLAWLTGQDLGALKLWSATKLSVGRYRVGKTVSSTGVLRRTASRCCPRCVLEAREQLGVHAIYELLEWKVLSLHRCQIHGTRLVTLPSAPHSHETYDFSTQALRHWKLVEEAAAKEAVLPQTHYEAYVRKRIRSGAPSDWLKSMDLTNLHGVCLSLGAALEGVKVGTIKSFDGAKVHELSEAGFLYLQKGPEGLQLALLKLRENSRSERPYFSADLGPFYRWLREVWDDKALAEITAATRTHIFDTYPVPMKKEVFGMAPKRQIWFTMEEARKRSGFGAVFLKRLLGHIKGIPEEIALKRTDVHVDELAEAQAFWAQLMNVSDAAKELGLRTTQVKSLQNRGVLRTVRITSSLRYLLCADVEKLLTRMNSLPADLSGLPVVPIKEFCRRKGVLLARVIDLWVRGDLEGSLCVGEGPGLQALEVNLDALCDKRKPRLDRNLTLTEAASYLQISVISIRHLRDNGFLSEVQSRNPDTRYLKAYITQESLRAFESRYVTLGRLASKQKVAPMHLARQLDRREVFPISCGKKQVRVYETSSVA